MKLKDKFDDVKVVKDEVLLKFKDLITGIPCNISVNNQLALENTKLVNSYREIDPRLRQLVIIVKKWAKSRGVNDAFKQTLSSYAYVLMCIYFLQQHRIPSNLPCLQEIESKNYKVNLGGDIICEYYNQVDKLENFGCGNRNCESIARLVWGFFRYWAYCHDYASRVISIRTKNIISKTEKGWNDHYISIEEPFKVSSDLGKEVDEQTFIVFRKEFERAAFIMEVDSDPLVKLFENKQQW
ncbi:UTP:RNA uridylyltransferase 1-like isoform X1 [Rutidosis leptorrhynchoides]|uniref:UTP:RNA uridylyltransferase 1-like isoform X1 n=1 Tax=Rutidosis leptorrhynchoides TaxID=125765 RepID=UPI003A996BE5